MNKIVVWVKEDYSEAEEFLTESNNKEEIAKLVHEKFPGDENSPGWFYYDIWDEKEN